MNLKEALAICVRARCLKDTLPDNCYQDLTNLKNDYIEEYGQLTILWPEMVQEEFCNELASWVKHWKLEGLVTD